ncbi:hypothetical protein [Spirosoma litoris]
MDPFQALTELPKLIEDYKRVSAELAQAQRELAALKDNQYVTWDWVCNFFGIDLKTAKLMLADEKLFVHNRQIKRFPKAAILSFAERNSVKVKDVYVMNYK